MGPDLAMLCHLRMRVSVCPRPAFCLYRLSQWSHLILCLFISLSIPDVVCIKLLSFSRPLNLYIFYCCLKSSVLCSLIHTQIQSVLLTLTSSYIVSLWPYQLLLSARSLHLRFITEVAALVLASTFSLIAARGGLVRLNYVATKNIPMDYCVP